MTLFRLFHRKKTPLEIWKQRFEAFMVGAGIILFWRGIWNLADHYLIPSNPIISAFASLTIGLLVLILSKNFVNQFLDEAVEEAEEHE